MVVALMFNKAAYNAAENNKTILSIEIVDPIFTNIEASEEFVDPNAPYIDPADPEYATKMEQYTYVKIFNNLSYMTLAHRQVLLSNYSICYYDKLNKKICFTTAPLSNRALTSFNKKYPMLSDQYLVPFV